MRIHLLDELAKTGTTFTVKELRKNLPIPQEILWVLLSRLEKQGRIERIEKGKYMVIPLGANKGSYTLHEFVLGSLLVQPCVISYWSALNYHGLTEQIPRTVFIQTTARKKKQHHEIFGVPYQIIRLKPEKIFGTEDINIEDTRITITNREKTIIDCLDKPKYGGGIVEVITALKEENLNLNTLTEYALRMKNSAIVRRLGYLSDALHIPIKLPRETMKQYLKKMRNYLPLDPTMPREGHIDKTWQLLINWDEL